MKEQRAKHDPVISRNLSQMEDDEFLWCLHCERVYQKKEIRKLGSFQYCAYKDCDGSAVLDGWDYLKFKDNNRFPKVPVKGVRYPLYN